MYQKYELYRTRKVVQVQKSTYRGHDAPAATDGTQPAQEAKPKLTSPVPKMPKTSRRSKIPASAMPRTTVDGRELSSQQATIGLPVQTRASIPVSSRVLRSDKVKNANAGTVESSGQTLGEPAQNQSPKGARKIVTRRPPLSPRGTVGEATEGARPPKTDIKLEENCPVKSIRGGARNKVLRSSASSTALQLGHIEEETPKQCTVVLQNVAPLSTVPVVPKFCWTALKISEHVIDSETKLSPVADSLSHSPLAETSVPENQDENVPVLEENVPKPDKSTPELVQSVTKSEDRYPKLMGSTSGHKVNDFMTFGDTLFRDVKQYRGVEHSNSDEAKFLSANTPIEYHGSETPVSYQTNSSQVFSVAFVNTRTVESTLSNNPALRGPNQSNPRVYEVPSDNFFGEINTNDELGNEVEGGPEPERLSTSESGTEPDSLEGAGTEDIAITSSSAIVNSESVLEAHESSSRVLAPETSTTAISGHALTSKSSPFKVSSTRLLKPEASYAAISKRDRALRSKPEISLSRVSGTVCGHGPEIITSTSLEPKSKVPSVSGLAPGISASVVPGPKMSKVSSGEWELELGFSPSAVLRKLRSVDNELKSPTPPPEPDGPREPSTHKMVIINVPPEIKKSMCMSRLDFEKRTIDAPIKDHPMIHLLQEYYKKQQIRAKEISNVGKVLTWAIGSFCVVVVCSIVAMLFARFY